jgi:hypothetical protein
MVIAESSSVRWQATMTDLPNARSLWFAPVQPWMAATKMLRLVTTQLKILNRIVCSIPVNVMHDFCRLQWSTNGLFHHVAMFSDVASVHWNVGVTSLVNVASSHAGNYTVTWSGPLESSP